MGTNYFVVELDSMNFHEGSTATGKVSFSLNMNTLPISVFISIIILPNPIYV